MMSIHEQDKQNRVATAQAAAATAAVKSNWQGIDLCCRRTAEQVLDAGQILPQPATATA
jgi:hypothetical protein